MKLNRMGALTLATIAALAGAASAATPVLQINADKVKAHASPTLYGLMTEEINFSYDGGLYGELIRNRNFKDDFIVNPPGRGGAGRGDVPATQPRNPITAPAHWSLVSPPLGVSMSLETNQPLSLAAPLSLRLNAENLPADQHASFANEGYWGIPVRPNATYKASFYAKRSVFGPRGPLTVSIESNDGKTVFAHADVNDVDTEWKQYTVDLPIGDVPPSSTNRFVISTGTAGDYWFTLVSLFPPTYNNRPNGNRVDLMQKLVDMKPSFLRFPGGNYVEGDTFEERFDWKNTIYPLANRPGHRSPWRYQSTDGMGLLEFLEWTEDMHAQPVLAVFAGYALRQQVVKAGPELDSYVQDALDEIEYVTGDASTKWGKQRIADGHPEPFPLKYVEIGNEDNFDRSGAYEGRFTQFHNAIKAKYPDLKLIATARLRTITPDLMDDHYYRQAREFERDVHHYDNADRNGPHIFVGEWATREGAPTTNLNAALGDAVWMTGMERNSDLIEIASYAPLFVNVNPAGNGFPSGMQWPSDLIGYDALNSYGSPSYYAQKMFSDYLGDTIPETSLTDMPTELAPANPPPRGRGAATATSAPAMTPLDQLYYSVTSNSKTGEINIKVINISASPQPLQINVAGANVADEALLSVLTSAAPTDPNTITDPVKIVPAVSTFNGVTANFTQTFAPYSVNVVQLKTH